MRRRAKWRKIALLLSLSAIYLGGCAVTAQPQKKVILKADEFNQLTSDAAQAYSKGNLAEAETLFTQLSASYPEDSRAVYNLAMLNLQKALEGLQHFISLEKDAALQQHAQGLLDKLAELR